MDDFRKNSLFSERGIAIITSLIIAIATIALIGGVFYMLQGGIKINTINRQFSTAQEAALGGIEHGATIIVMHHKGALAENEDLRKGLGIDITDYESEIDTSDGLKLRLRTAGGRSASQGQFDIRVTVQRLNSLSIPAQESPVFPPPASGTGGSKSYYVFYRIRSIAKDPITNSISEVEAVYRVAI
ncbi:MAG: hypothetical protein ACP5TY_01750 [Thermodesulforhabdaceae bacterium]